jgi:CheY-like chemotaxis protein/HPt (histidine-containing phosphotransfer) domain-containing protein
VSGLDASDRDELLGVFLLEAPERAARIELALEDLEGAGSPSAGRAAGSAVAGLAHSLSGAAATVGLVELARRADELELAFGDGEAPDAAAAIAEARRALAGIRAALADAERSAEPGPEDGGGAAVTVLHVEDNPLNARLVERVLARRPRVRLVAATSGTTAIRLARERRPDLILLDLNLPDMSGVEVLDRLRRDPETRGLEVVVVTAHEPARTSSRLRDLGVGDYLPKPIDVGRLLEVVDGLGER